MVTPVSSPNSPTRTPVSPPPTKPQQTKAAKDAVTPSAKKPALPTKGSFDTVIRTMTRTLPVSVDWEVIGNYVNGYARIRGYVKYIYQGQLVSYALDQNYSHIIDGKLWFSARVLNGTYAAETKVDVQQKKFDAIRAIIKEILESKGKPVDRVKVGGVTVGVLAGKLYGALLSYGVDDIKYGRSAFAARIRTWLTAVLNPKRAGWQQAKEVVSALHQLGLGGARGKPFKVALRPIEKADLPKKAGNGTSSFFVSDPDDLRNIMDRVLAQMGALASRILRRQPTVGAETIWRQMERTGRGIPYIAAQIADELARPGVLAPEGLGPAGELIITDAIQRYWAALRQHPNEVDQRPATADFTRALRNLGANPQAIQPILAGLRTAPFAVERGHLGYLGQFVMVNARRNLGR